MNRRREHGRSPPRMRVIETVHNDRVHAWPRLRGALFLHGREQLGPDGLTAELEGRLPGEQALVHTLTKACDRQLRKCREWVQWKPMLLVGDHDRCKHVTRMIVKAACIEAAWFDAREGDSMFAPRLPRGGQTGAPSWPVMIMAALDTANPAIIIDHADEASAALVEQLSSMMVAEARHWLDTGLGCTVRLDAISWILATDKPEDVSPKLRAISHRIRLAAPSIA